jgi:AcrR family transcriptional regulator
MKQKLRKRRGSTTIVTGPVREKQMPRRVSKGEARRRAILDAAASLLETSALEELTYRAVCGRAGVPESSAYHFFPDLAAIYRALLSKLGDEHDRYLLQELSPAQRESWQAIVRTTMDRSATFQRRHPVFAKLTISGKVPFELKQSDRTADRRRARFILEAVDKYFVLPRLDALDEIFYIGCELYDQVAILSMIQYGELTPTMIEHGKVAVTAFIDHYIGVKLAVRPARELARVVALPSGDR